MAAGAGRVGWAEGCAGMASLAGNICMRTVQYKTCAEVIKCFLRRRRHLN